MGSCEHPETESVFPEGSDIPVAEICVDCLDRVGVGYNCDICGWQVVRIVGGPTRKIRVTPCSEHVERQRVYF